MKLPFGTLCLLFVAGRSPLAQADEFWGEAGLGFKWADFSYQEIEGDENLLEEKGSLPGISVNLRAWFNDEYWLQVEGEKLSGTTDYIGQTQLGTPLKTSTAQQLNRYQIKVGWQVEALGIYAGVGMNRWHRSIQATKTTQGLTEVYFWWDAAIGADYQVEVSSDNRFIFHAELNRSISPEVEVALERLGAGKPRLALHEEFGFQAGMSYRHRLSRRWEWVTQLDYRYYAFGRSDTQQLSTGSRVFTIHEPSSDSSLVSLTTGFQLKF